MRGLSPSFMDDLCHGPLKPLTEKVRDDSDLDLQIRADYLNIYFKGNALLKLKAARGQNYHWQIDAKFLTGLDKAFTASTHADPRPFLRAVPHLKENITRFGKHSLEIEYEQLIIRANNYEPANNSELFILDRQYASGQSRLDLTGFFWSRSGRRKGQTVPLCFLEVKFALNSDIKEVASQLDGYYREMAPKLPEFAEEMQTVLQQKLQLGAFKNSKEQLAALQTLSFSQDIRQCRFILIPVDYNPHSTLLNEEALRSLPFADQIRIFRSGFAIWDSRLETL